MTGDEELDAILAMLCGELDDAELDRRVAGFRGALRRLREDPAEDTRIDALAADADDGPAVVALVTRAAGGDPDAWAEIVQYTPLVWSICTRFKLSSADTEHVGQMVWLLTAGRLGRLRDPAALPGWLASTTQRECLRVINTAGKYGQRGTELDEALQSAGDTAIDEEIPIAELNAVLLEAFAELSPHCQQLLSMLLADPPYSYAEISATLNIPVGSIGPQRARCLERLRRSNAFIAWGREARSCLRDTGQMHDNPDGR
jgi:RNA polymerase sigma factor (sigma-70 family)